MAYKQQILNHFLFLNDFISFVNKDPDLVSWYSTRHKSQIEHHANCVASPVYLAPFDLKKAIFSDHASNFCSSTSNFNITISKYMSNLAKNDSYQQQIRPLVFNMRGVVHQQVTTQGNYFVWWSDYENLFEEYSPAYLTGNVLNILWLRYIPNMYCLHSHIQHNTNQWKIYN